MKFQRQVPQVVFLSILVCLLGASAASAQVGPGPFAAFPSQSTTDGRFMGFGCAGVATFEQDVAIAMATPAAISTFDLNIFDGDTGQGSLPHWDLGTRQLIFSLYADPLRTGSTAPADLIGTWAGNAANPTSGPLWISSASSMPDNDWWAVTVTNAPIAQEASGNYSYNLVIALDGSCDADEMTQSNIKIAASHSTTFRMQHFGLVAAFNQFSNDGPILYPDSFPPPGGFLSAPTTYDGTFEFFFNLPGGETELRLYDGDFDLGTDSTVGSPSGVPLDACTDQDDLDTPADYGNFPFATSGANPEGAQGPGFPPDDNHFDAFRRGEPGDPNRIGCVRYEVTDPEGNVYFDDNPSGSFEWEQFLIAHPSSAMAGNADWVYEGLAASLPAGVWRVKIVSLDLSNLNYWFGDTCATRPARDPLPGEDPADVPREAACSNPSIYLLGDFVWADTANPGVMDPFEVGIPGVLMELIRQSDGEVIATAITGDTTNPNWPACLANNTGIDTAGLYCFGTDTPGTYEVRVASVNFDPGHPLVDNSSTTGGESLTRTLTTGNVLTYDFGYNTSEANGSLGDRVWLDNNGDGIQNAGEPGLNGVTLELLDGFENVIEASVTAGNGSYAFPGLAAGAYSVRVVAATLPAGLAETYDLDGPTTANITSVNLAATQNRTDVDFGYRGTASIGDRVWTDTDSDGLQDLGETGINGVTVELLDSGSEVIGTQITAGDGYYNFANFSAGNYSVRLVAATLPPGLTQTFDLDGSGTANIATFALAAGQNKTDVDFGYRGTASIGDRVWNDTDGDGLQDPGEPGINGVTIELLNPGGTVIATQVTSGIGNYTFPGLAAGAYSVRVVAATLPAGLAETYDLDGPITANITAVNLAAGQNRTDVDFGYRGTASIGDRVWTDTNGDGVQNAGEIGINGVTVELLDSGSVVIGTQITAGDGNYNFANRLAGFYQVRVMSSTLPVGSVQTYDLDGVETANLASFALAAGQNKTDVNFGYRSNGSIGDRVWYDFDSDGVQDAGEAGLNGVTIELLNSGSVVIDAQSTAGDGNYIFSNLAAGSYKVRVVSSTLPAGSVRTFDLDGILTPNIATATLAAGQDRTDVDFGYRGNGSIGDRVWYDFDGDGVQDTGETGINGATVDLVHSSGMVLATRVTSGNGNYTFPNLPAGTYTARVVTSTLPSGLDPTFDRDGLTTPNVATVALNNGQKPTNVDFGYRGRGSIGDQVWRDIDGDGVLDLGETGISGATVTLVDGFGNTLATRVTNASGVYGFPGLPAGNYNVSITPSTLPVGLVPAYDLDGPLTPHVAMVALAMDQVRTDLDFGYRGLGSIGDRVWLDIFGGSVQQPGEPGLNGVTVELQTTGGATLLTQATSGDGNYLFTNLPAGSYRVRVMNGTLPAGLQATFDLDGLRTLHYATVALAVNQNRTDVDFGYWGKGSIGDKVWRDLDGDGVLDSGESGISGATVTLADGFGNFTATTATDGMGSYLFRDLPPGNYTITTTLPAGWVPTYDLDGPLTPHVATIALAMDQIRTDVDFGYRGLGSIGDRVWRDLDGDGIQNGEPGLNGVTVQLQTTGGATLLTKVTSGNGNYLFTDLPSGTYRVRVMNTSLPGGLQPTFDLDGVNASRHYATVVLGISEIRLDADFGYR